MYNVKNFLNFFRRITYLSFIPVIVFAALTIGLNLYNVPDTYSLMFFIAGIVIFISGQLLLFIMQQKQTDDEMKEKMDRIIELLEKQNQDDDMPDS